MFDYLTAKYDTGRRVNKKIVWHCECKCGNTKAVRGDHLRRGLVVSCGCWQKESARRRAASGEKSGSVRRTHGLSRHRVYPVYKAMLARCLSPRCRKYPDYGGRGVTVCDRWRGDQGFERFISDMGLPPARHLTIERKENDGNYEPGNCRWATRKEQARNRRNTRRVLYQGADTLLVDVAVLCGVPYKELHRRLKRGWTLERATTQPLRGE